LEKVEERERKGRKRTKTTHPEGWWFLHNFFVNGGFLSI
jgi:hypothetical protein